MASQNRNRDLESTNVEAAARLAAWAGEYEEPPSLTEHGVHTEPEPEDAHEPAPRLPTPAETTEAVDRKVALNRVMARREPAPRGAGPGRSSGR